MRAKHEREAQSFLQCSINNREELKKQLEEARKQSDGMIQAMVKKFASWGSNYFESQVLSLFAGGGATVREGELEDEENGDGESLKREGESEGETDSLTSVSSTSRRSISTRSDGSRSSGVGTPVFGNMQL